MTSSPRQQSVALVMANVPVCRDHHRLVVRIDRFPPTRPGQFIQIACRNLELDYSPEIEHDWEPGQRIEFRGTELRSPLAMLRRPFSLAGRRDLASGAVEIEIIHRVVGIGTDWLAHLTEGDHVNVLGPLGNTFDLPKPQDVALLVGGGVGIPPMLYLTSQLVGCKAVAFCGALTRDLLPLTVTADAPQPALDGVQPLYNILEFSRHGVPALISTDDGSYGYRGFVTQALEAYLDRYFPASSSASPVIYTCGSEPMMKRVAEIAERRSYVCQIAVERAMACGMGTCQSCCIKVKKPDRTLPPLAGQDWCYRLACTDGPVFTGSQLLW